MDQQVLFFYTQRYISTTINISHHSSVPIPSFKSIHLFSTNHLFTHCLFWSIVLLLELRNRHVEFWTAASPYYISYWMVWRKITRRLIIQIMQFWIIDVHRTYTCIGILTDTGRKWFVPDSPVPAKTCQCTASMETVSRVAGVQDESAGIMTVVLDFIAIARDTWFLTAY